MRIGGEIQLKNEIYSIRLPREVSSGAGSIQKLREVLRRKKQILLLADPVLVKLDYLRSVLELLEQEGKAWRLESEIPSEPQAQQIEAVLNKCRGMHCDCVLGIGGGSVLDTAKLLALLLETEKSVFDLMQNPSIEETRLLPLVLVPTTAGTGSEATPNAIVTDTSRNMKVGIVNQAFIPDTVILDPAFTMTLPQSVTAATGMDALAHALECYISKKANPISDTYAIEAMRLIFSNLLTAYQQPDHADARHAMLYAAFLGGLCIATSSTTAVHALAYPLGGKYHIPHGVSNAMLLPAVMEFNRSVITDKLYTVAVRCMGLPASVTKEEAADAVIRQLYAFSRQMQIPTDLKKYGIRPGELDQLAEEGFAVRRLLDNNPKQMQLSDVREIYETLL